MPGSIKVCLMASWPQSAGGARLRAALPDSVWCCLPGKWPLEDGARFTFGCDGDFRPIGGPERVVMMEYRRAQLVRWGCEDRV